MALTLLCRVGRRLGSGEIPALAKPRSLFGFFRAAWFGLLGPFARLTFARSSFFLAAGGESAGPLDDPMTGQPLLQAGLEHLGQPAGPRDHGGGPQRGDFPQRLREAQA